MSIFSLKLFSDDKSYLYDLEEKIQIDLPEEFTIITEDSTGSIQTSNNNCYVNYQSVVRFENKNSNFINHNFTDKLSSLDMLPVMFVFELKNCDKYLVYCVDTKEYNPSTYNINCDYVVIAYDYEENCMLICEFYIKDIK